MANKRITSPSAPQQATKASNVNPGRAFNQAVGRPVFGATGSTAGTPGPVKPTVGQMFNNAVGQKVFSTPIAAPKTASAAPRTSVGAGGRAAASAGGGGYVPGTTLGTSATGQAAAVSQPMSDEDWWNSDADFQVERAGLQSTLDNALASLAAKRASYDTDFVSTLKNLGWDWNGDDAGSLADVANGRWDPTNKLGAYGAGNQNLNNDFASRGMLDSSFFADALTNFNTDFNNQFSNLTQGRNAFLQDNGDNTGQGLAARNEFQNALARARQSSLARRNVAI